jgi:hypothetical protein
MFEEVAAIDATLPAEMKTEAAAVQGAFLLFQRARHSA